MRRTLVFDADDTLWDEQGVLQQFEAQVEELLDRRAGGGSEFRRVFIALEDENIPALGYGFASYVFSVAEAIATRPEWHRHKAEVLGLVADLIAGVQSAGPRVIEGVVPTLERLNSRDYRLVLLTRGIEFEQRAKLERSGLASYFAEVRVVSRKDADAYRAAALALGDPRATALCMIGNSLRSDVNPALEAGWRAIHVPAPTDWAHDAAEVATAAGFYRAERIGQVADLVQSAEFWR
jgi:putative hydrolase of the HAD superfamily